MPCIMRRDLALVIVLIGFLLGSCQPSKVNNPITVAFYNVENLFDTIDAPNKFDEEFTPTEPKNWNTKRYNKKLKDLSEVLSQIDTIQLPVIIGLCEVENKTVLQDLVNESKLKDANYGIVWEDGPDFRGIDNALLYNPQAFSLIKYEAIPVLNPEDKEWTTRDLLYVNGMLYNEEFHFFVCHWPSRRGGAEKSAPKRVLAANVVRKKVDEIQKKDLDANIVIMGDMNDEPNDIALSDVLMAVSNAQTPTNSQLVNLMYDEFEDGMGSYRYRGNWDMIDNLIVSGALINKKKGLKTSLDNGFVFHKPFMEYVNDKGEMSPNRTYGRSYYGGISDHFPIYMTLE